MKQLLFLVVGSLLGSLSYGHPQAITQPPAVNPWEANCPVPSSFTITDYQYLRGKGDYPTFNISYGEGTFKCPVRPNAMTFYEGWTIMTCDEDGLVEVVTDGNAYMSVRQKYWCPSVPQANNSFSTLETFVSSTPYPAGFMNCVEIENISYRVQLCVQTQTEFIIPVETYSIGGTIDFKPLNINGSLLTQCPTVYGVNPIVTDVLNCNSTTPTIPAGTGTASAGYPVKTEAGWQLRGRWGKRVERRGV